MRDHALLSRTDDAPVKRTVLYSPSTSSIVSGVSSNRSPALYVRVVLSSCSDRFAPLNCSKSAYSVTASRLDTASAVRLPTTQSSPASMVGAVRSARTSISSPWRAGF